MLIITYGFQRNKKSIYLNISEEKIFEIIKHQHLSDAYNAREKPQ